jgi:acid phosphatase family membrane protein YuiD
LFNPYIVVPFVAWAVTQFLKFIIAALNGRLDFRYLYASGGMPSVHSSVVTSLATTSFLVAGPNSFEFGITAVLAAVVMYDSFGVRRASGEQATAINMIIDSMQQDRIRLAHPQARLREILGHKPLEVSVGAVLGFLIGVLLNLDHAAGLISVMTAQMPLYGFWGMVVLSAILVVGGLIARWLLLARYGRTQSIARLVKTDFWLAWLIGWVGLIVAFLHYEKLEVAGWALWPLLYIIILAVAVITFVSRALKVFPPALAAQEEQTQKARWFEGPSKKKRKRS